MGESKILFVVEGEKTDVKLMKRLLKLYGISDSHKIISYNTNIYTLYNQLPESYEEYADIDLLQLLKEREFDEAKRNILSDHYSDVLLVFDLDPQAPDFAPYKIMRMANYFTESTDMGKLYLNYPMVESFYHMTSIPDERYIGYTVNMEILLNKKYKQLVHNICRDGDYSKFAKTKDEASNVIRQNMEKAKLLVGAHSNDLPDAAAILVKELELLENQNLISVLCTCVFYIAEYNGDLL